MWQNIHRNEMGTKPLCRLGIVALLAPMGWKPITTLHCLIREEKRLRIICECGHVAEPDTRELIGAIYKRHRRRSVELKDLHRQLRCGACGGKRFGYELLDGAIHSRNQNRN